MHFVYVAVFAFLLSASTTGQAENWPQWRGPNLNGVSLEKNLPVSWSPTENIAWKLEMPAWSGSTPIIWEDRIFLNVADGDHLYLWCVDRKQGTVLWKKLLGGGNVKMRKQNMSSPSPVTDGFRVWVMTGTGVLKGFELDGTEVWSRNLQEEYGDFGLNWGYASSPLLYRDSLYIQVLHGMKTDDPSYVMAVDKHTGKNRWRVERPTDALLESPDAYTTPTLLNLGGVLQLVVSGGDYVTGHDLETGRELWRAGGLNPGKGQWYRIVASPTVWGDLIFVPSRVKPFIAFRAVRQGEATQVRPVWSTDHGPDVPTPVTDGKSVYIVNDKGILWCLDAQTGKEIWGQERVRPGTYSASPLLADGKLYVTSEDGVTTVVKAGPQFEILAENDLGGYTLSSPAVSRGQIFLRTDSHLYCIGERASGQ